MVLKKTPKAGDWWICKETQKPVYIVGMDPEGDPVWMENIMDAPDVEILNDFLLDFEYAPECDGWDWKPKHEQNATWQTIEIGGRKYEIREST